MEGGELLLGGQVDVAIGLAALVFGHAVPVEVVDVLDALHVHDEALEPVGELGGDRIAVDAADLLEVGELADLHAVAPDLPAEAPGARSEEHTSELQSLMRISYAVFCLKNKKSTT